MKVITREIKKCCTCSIIAIGFHDACIFRQCFEVSNSLESSISQMFFQQLAQSVFLSFQILCISKVGCKCHFDFHERDVVP